MNIWLTTSEREDLIKEGYTHIMRHGLEIYIELSDDDERGYIVVIMDNVKIPNFNK